MSVGYVGDFLGQVCLIIMLFGLVLGWVVFECLELYGCCQYVGVWGIGQQGLEGIVGVVDYEVVGVDGVEVVFVGEVGDIECEFDVFGKIEFVEVVVYCCVEQLV